MRAWFLPGAFCFLVGEAGGGGDGRDARGEMKCGWRGEFARGAEAEVGGWGGVEWLQGVGRIGVVGWRIVARGALEGADGLEERFGGFAGGLEGAGLPLIDDLAVGDAAEDGGEDVVEGGDGGAGALGAGDLLADEGGAAELGQLGEEVVARDETAKVERGHVVFGGDGSDAAAAVEEVGEELGAARLIEGWDFDRRVRGADRGLGRIGQGGAGPALGVFVGVAAAGVHCASPEVVLGAGFVARGWSGRCLGSVRYGWRMCKGVVAVFLGGWGGGVTDGWQWGEMSNAQANGQCVAGVVWVTDGT